MSNKQTFIFTTLVILFAASRLVEGMLLGAARREDGVLRGVAFSIICSVKLYIKSLIKAGGLIFS